MAAPNELALILPGLIDDRIVSFIDPAMYLPRVKSIEGIAGNDCSATFRQLGVEARRTVGATEKTAS